MAKSRREIRRELPHRRTTKARRPQARRREKTLSETVHVAPDGTKHIFRVVMGDGEWPRDPVAGYNPEKDWWAWRHTIEERGRNFLPSTSPGTPSPEALRAVQSAVEWRFSAPSNSAPINAQSLSLGASLTAYFGNVRISFSELQPPRGDLLIDALNRYPHPASASCRWLLPAVRNLIGGPREEPDELWSRWREEEERLYRVSLHPHSIVFQGSPEKHNLIDYEHDSHHSPMSRTALERWRIRAHLMNVPAQWKFDHGYCVEGWPRLSPARLTALTHYSVNVLRGVIWDRQYVEPEIREFRTYLLRNAADRDLPMGDRRRYRRSLVLLNSAAAYNLLQKPTFKLDYYHVREYDKLRSAISMQWRWSKKFPFQRRLEVCKQFLVERGWRDSADATRFLNGVELGLCSPREIAGLLVCMREELQVCHPQTFAEAIAAARRIYPDREPGAPARKRRGRPPKSREFSPTTSAAD